MPSFDVTLVAQQDYNPGNSCIVDFVQQSYYFC